jgi:hypothetical protein
LPDATPTSTAPPSTARRNKGWIAVQILLTAIVLWFVGKALVDQWREFRGEPLEVNANWSVIAASGAVFLATYAVLIETLRRILVMWSRESGGTAPAVSFLTVARLWSISNLGRYVPGKVWGIGAMAAMAQQAGVGGVAAAGSAVLNTLVNIATGFVVALAAGWTAFGRVAQGGAVVGVIIAGVGMVGLLALPVLLPRMLDVVRRVTGRSISLARVPARVVHVAIAGNVLAWLMYAAAFELFVFGVMGRAPGTFADYVTAYAWPYILGYLAIFAPGGIGVRDGALAAALHALGIATPAEAAVISVTSRLWLTVLELLPGLLFLAVGARPRSKATH